MVYRAMESLIHLSMILMPLENSNLSASKPNKDKSLLVKIRKVFRVGGRKVMEQQLEELRIAPRRSFSRTHEPQCGYEYYESTKAARSSKPWNRWREDSACSLDKTSFVHLGDRFELNSLDDICIWSIVSHPISSITSKSIGAAFRGPARIAYRYAP